MYLFIRGKRCFYFCVIDTKGVDVMSKEIKYTDAVPNSIVTRYKEDNIQYLLDQVARLTAENAMLKEKWSTSKPEQEPVAWIIETEIHGKLSEWVCTDKKHYMEEHDGTKDPIPLYTAPPKREPLSDDEIVKLWANKSPINEFECVRLVEKAHGIGGGE